MATSPDLFDAYFRRADTDRDGRISGQEAVSFFQGANLNREVLAKVCPSPSLYLSLILSAPERSSSYSSIDNHSPNIYISKY